MNVLYPVFFLSLAIRVSASEVSEATLKGVSDFYDEIVSSLAPSNVPFADIYKQPLTLEERFGYKENPFDYYPAVVFVQAQFIFQVTKEPHPKLIALYNNRLRQYISTNELQRVPAWTPLEAIGKAKDILKILHIPAVTNMVLKDVLFGGMNDDPVWRIRWEPRVQNIRYNTLPEQETQEIEVSISERHGFVGYRGRYDFPAPKRMDVLIKQEDAIAKAAKAVPFIQRGPYFWRGRPSRITVSGVYSAQLLIAAPNWLLDPKRAVWIRNKPPDETRLCWVITFTSVYAGQTEANETRIAPVFIVYIDAATGEIVGANFT